MASARTHRRVLSAVAACAIALLAALAAGALLSTGLAAAARGPGGTAPGGRPASTPSTPTQTPVRISGVSCVPYARCSSNPHKVTVRGQLLISGSGLRAGMVVVFPRKPGARISRTSPGAHLRKTSAGLLVTVPRSAHSGRIMVLIDRLRHTGSVGPITIVKYRLHPPRRRTRPIPNNPVSGTAFDGQGMWIWYVSKSNGGNVASIIERAHTAGVTTLFIKSSDGASNYWSQFSPQLVAELHAAGIKACGWQYVYGSNPAGEAALGARAVANGADCLVIDAESEYEGKYSAAQTYINTLREKIGPSYPLALATFPYVNFHRSEPYSVFLGPGAAQYNAPQMYWKAIGQSVDTVYANTWIGNRIYGRPIFPLGQTYENVSAKDLFRFRQEAPLYGATGVSFWDWQETSASGWATLAAPLTPLTTVTPNSDVPELRKGSKGDQVLWLQEHLAAAIPTQETTGTFSEQTTANLASFQASHGIEASGIATPATWTALLALTPVAVDWTGTKPSI